nr:AraC family transcriptional regulator [Georgenia thermotolerans]
MATFPTHDLPPPLRPFVAAAHGYAVPTNPTGVHRGLPSRHLTLVVELPAPLRLSGLGGPVAAHAVAGGLHTRPVLIDASAPQEGLQYALTPLGAAALLGLPAAELAGLAVDLADLLPEADLLVEQVWEAPDWATRFRRVDEALLARLAGREPPAAQPEVAEAWRVIFRRGGQVRVGDVAAHVGWGRRHLSERFRLATGPHPARGRAHRPLRARPRVAARPGPAGACRRRRPRGLRRPVAPGPGVAGAGRVQRRHLAA